MIAAKDTRTEAESIVEVRGARSRRPAAVSTFPIRATLREFPSRIAPAARLLTATLQLHRSSRCSAGWWKGCCSSGGRKAVVRGARRITQQS